MFKVRNKEFVTFEDVIEWTWNTHKVSFECDIELSEAEQKEACEDLGRYLESQGLTE